MSLQQNIAKAIQKADKSYFFENYSKQARSVISSLEKQGYMIVPKDPTEDMLQAGSDAILPGRVKPEVLAKLVFESMVLAAKKKR